MRRLLPLSLLLLLASPLARPHPRPYPQARASGGATFNVSAAASINISAAPAAPAPISVSATQIFTITIVNDSGNKGANLTLSGPSCAGATCGTISPAFVRTGATVTYTAPATVPSPSPQVALTLTSIGDSTRFTAVTLTITAPPSPGVVNNVYTPTAVVTSAASNPLPITATTGNFMDVIVYDVLGNTVTGVQACKSGSCTTLTQACTTGGVCLGTTGGHGHVQHFYGIGLVAGQNSVVVANSPASGNLDIVVLDASNIQSFNSATVTIDSTNAPGAQGPTIIQPGAGLVISGLASTNNVTNVTAPLVFQGTAFGDGAAYILNPMSGTFQPNWFGTGTTFWGMTAAFTAGTVSPTIGVSISPTSASVVTSATKQFTATVTNDTRGVNWTLTGAGCSGATCGTLSLASTASGIPTTYTAPVGIPTPPTVTLTATSIGDATKTATATITVVAAPAITVAVSPTSATKTVSTTQAFTPTVTNDGGAAGVDWTLSGAGCAGATCGTLSATHTASGVATTYTAPASVPSPALVTLTAASTTDSSKTASAAITVIAATISVTVSPTSVTVPANGASQPFTATIFNDAHNVTWTLSGSGCTGTACGTVSPTITASGVSTSYTPPATAPNPSTVTLTATSTQDNTKSASATITVTTSPGPFKCSAPCPAFPEAQGGGAAAHGGRGGPVGGSTVDGTPQVIYVTNLNDSGAGSLRACMAASGPRTCIFRVSGLITFLSRMQVFNPHLTVAGQTAPGGAIVIGGTHQNAEQIFISTNDVVIRYLTWDGFSIAPNSTGPDSGTVCCEMASGDIFNIMWDHMSSRWSGNKAFPVVSNVSGLGVHNMTIQWTLIYEPNVLHAVGIGTVFVNGAQGGDGLKTTDDDAHHNAFITVDHRIPLNQSGRNVRWVNNLAYNWGQFAALSMGGVQTDYIGNKFIDSSGGNLNYSDVHVFTADGNGCDPSDQTGDCGGNNETGPTMYFLNNIGRTGRANASTGGSYVSATHVVNDAGQVSMTAKGAECGDQCDPNSTGAFPSAWFRSTPLPAETFPIKADPVENLDAILLPTVGNSQHLDCQGNWMSNRDSQDARIINVYQQRLTDNLFNGQFKAPAIPTGVACTTSQNDGIPDAWKTRYGLSTSNANLWKTLDPNTGEIYLYDYLDGLVP